MTQDDFWYGELELMSVYIKAYFDNIKYTSWLNGYYVYVANITANANAWGGDKGKDVKYPDFEDIEGTDKSIKETNEIELNKNDYSLLSQLY